MKLAPCPSCARHVRVDEAACPFCHSAFTAPLVALTTVPKISRVIAIAMSATLAGAALEGCVPGPQPAYGGPPPPSDAGPGDEDAGTGAAEYGAPPPPSDAGAVDAGTVDVDAGNGSADY